MLHVFPEGPVCRASNNRICSTLLRSTRNFMICPTEVYLNHLPQNSPRTRRQVLAIVVCYLALSRCSNLSFKTCLVRRSALWSLVLPLYIAHPFLCVDNCKCLLPYYNAAAMPTTCVFDRFGLVHTTVAFIACLSFLWLRYDVVSDSWCVHSRLPFCKFPTPVLGPSPWSIAAPAFQISDKAS